MRAMPALDRLEAGRLKFAPFAECATVFTAAGIFCHRDRSERSGGINAKRFILLRRFQANRFALIPPLHSA